MSRTAKPWYWKARRIWCVYHHGKKTLLSPDRDKALRRHHGIMAKLEETYQPPQWGAVAVILDDYLTWTEENRASKTFTRYRDFIQSFVVKYGRMESSSIWIYGVIWPQFWQAASISQQNSRNIDSPWILNMRSWPIRRYNGARTKSCDTSKGNGWTTGNTNIILNNEGNLNLLARDGEAEWVGSGKSLVVAWSTRMFGGKELTTKCHFV